MILKISARFFDDLRTSDAGDEACGAFVRALSYCARFRLGVAVVSVRFFDRFSDRPDHVREALVRSGLAVADVDRNGRSVLALQGRGELWDLHDSAGVPVDVRREVLRRDGACVYCGSADRLTVDHVVPRSKGGDHTAENLVAACRACNSRKSNRTPEQWAANAPARRGLQ